VSQALGRMGGSVRSGRMTLVLSLAATLVATPPAAARAATPTECRGGIAASTVDSLSDLPLRVVRPAPGESAPDLAVFLTGDGGWAAIDNEISDSLARHGIPVVALNSREYLANKRTPQRVASDVARIIRYYGRSFGRSAVLLIGYSRGADILPFVANRLPREIRSQVRLIALLGLAPNANFKFHLIDLITNHHRPDDLPTLPEVRRLHGAHILCFYGVQEKEAACRSLADSVATVVAMPSGHHFGGRYGVIADRILSALATRVTPVTTSRP
jgi:Type IV secretory pathway, VirJ component